MTQTTSVNPNNSLALSRGTGVAGEWPAGAFTVTFRAKALSWTGNQYQALLYAQYTLGTNETTVYAETAADELRTYTINPSGGEVAVATGSPTSWCEIYISWDGVAANGVLSVKVGAAAAVTRSFAATALTLLQVFNDPYAEQADQARGCTLTVWNGLLTGGEITSQLASDTAITPGTATLWAFYPMSATGTAGTDTSGNARHLTPTGTGATVSDVPYSSSSISGTAAGSLDGLTAAATGALTMPGTAAGALDGLTAAAAGALSMAGTVAGALDGLTASATGALTLDGTVAASADGLAASAAGSLELGGTLAGVLDGLVASGAGAFELGGTAAGVLDGLTASAAGVVETGDITGFAAASLDGLTAAGTGALELAGSVAASLDGPTASAGGSLELTGSVAGLLDGLIASADGSLVVSEITGSVDASLGAAEAAAVGGLEISGSVAAEMAAVEAQALEVEQSTTPARGSLRFAAIAQGSITSLQAVGRLTLRPLAQGTMS